MKKNLNVKELFTISLEKYCWRILYDYHGCGAFFLKHHDPIHKNIKKVCILDFMKCKSICEPSLCVVLDVHRKVCWLAGNFGMHSYAWETCLLRMNTELSCPDPSCSYPWCFILSIRDTVLSSDARRDAWCCPLCWVTEKRPAVGGVSQCSDKKSLGWAVRLSGGMMLRTKLHPERSTPCFSLDLLWSIQSSSWI